MDRVNEIQPEAVQETRAPMIRPLMTEAVIQLRALNVAGERFRAAAANHFGIDALEVAALGWLGLSGPMSAARLADAMRVDSSACAPVLDRLDAAGMTVRSPDPDSPGTELATITKRGLRVLTRTREWMATALDVFDDDHLVQALHVLTELRLALEHRTEAINATHGKS